MTEMYTHIETRVPCPVCGAEFENIQGHIRAQIGALGDWYRVGDSIRWNKHTAPEQARLATFSSLYAFDCDDNFGLWKCGACATLFDSPAALIESGKITKICLMTQAQAQELFGFERGDADIVGYSDIDKKWMPVQG